MRVLGLCLIVALIWVLVWRRPNRVSPRPPQGTNRDEAARPKDIPDEDVWTFDDLTR